MNTKEESTDLIQKFNYESKHFLMLDAKECALIAVERNILMFTELVNRMDDFSNESRQVIWQLIEDELELKHELNKSE